MQQHDSDFVIRSIRQHVADELADATTAINPDEFGRRICQRLTESQRDTFASFGTALLLHAYVDEVRRQTKNQPADPEQVEAFPMESWISAANAGERIRYRDAKWEDHVAHRERQITNVRRVNRAFDLEERRREQLRSVGMADDPTMTTEQAVRVLDSTAVAAD